jgi:hypothetical protein
VLVEDGKRSLTQATPKSQCSDWIANTLPGDDADPDTRRAKLSGERSVTTQETGRQVIPVRIQTLRKCLNKPDYASPFWLSGS